jgi:hypothetical protein
MATTEHTINDALAEVLSETRSLWRVKGIVKSENIDVLKSSGKRPDILVNEPNVSPVIIETEIMPAVSVEKDAIERLGQQLYPSGKTILSVVAIRLSARLRELSGQELKRTITDSSDFEMALYSGESDVNYLRFPAKGWLRGNTTALSLLVQSASLPQPIIDAAANKLVGGVVEAAAILSEMAMTHPGAIQKICEELKQENGEQTLRMAMTILANALVFHESLARGNGDLGKVRTLDEFGMDKNGVSKNDILTDWQIILNVNYWPIFDIARRMLEVIPADNAKILLDHLIRTASELVSNNLMRSHDLTGAVFQRLIADRKFLAAYYTHPASAALLVGLAIKSKKTPGGGEWGKENDVTSLRIADFACGTGTLLSTAYCRIGQLHEAAGGDSETIHPEMMAESLIGCDVLPAAAHLTASMLASAHPTVKYDHSSVMAVAYGPRDDGGVALGSLDLLDPQRPFDIIAITGTSLGGKGAKEKELWSALPHQSFDVVIMNPPFTRDTGHEGVKTEVPNPTFAAFESTAEQQRLMAQAAERLLKGTSAHGNAGEASSFLVLDDRKLKDNGTLALVMPLSLMSGDAWESSRNLLRKSYSELVFVSISGSRPHDLSFSADTGMGECLVVGRKSPQERKRATFVVIKERPSSTTIGASIANQIHEASSGNLRKLEDGPVGGSPIRFGDDIIGFALDAPLPAEGPWGIIRMSDASLAQVAYQITSNGTVWLPGMSKTNITRLPISTLSMIGRVGPVDRDINGNASEGGIRGPFKIEHLYGSAVPTYPVLWAHDAKRERHMEFEADSEGIIRQGANSVEDIEISKKVEKIWSTASHCHFNRDFQFNSQSTAMQFTNKRTIGGMAWPSIILDSIDHEKALVLWANSTLGILIHWWHANKQQAGRGRIGVSPLASLPVLDLAKISPEALSTAAAIFDDIKNKDLYPINKISVDAVRHEIDIRLCSEVLGLPPELTAADGSMDLIRQKLALEPSINGGKSV